MSSFKIRSSKYRHVFCDAPKPEVRKKRRKARVLLCVLLLLLLLFWYCLSRDDNGYGCWAVAVATNIGIGMQCYGAICEGVSEENPASPMFLLHSLEQI
jgi:hypothetical protein